MIYVLFFIEAVLYLAGGGLTYFIHLMMESHGPKFSRWYVYPASVFWPITIVIYAIIYVIASAISLM